MSYMYMGFVRFTNLSVCRRTLWPHRTPSHSDYKIIKLSHWQQPAGTHVAVFDYEILKQRLGFRSSKQIKADIAELSSTFHLVKYEQ